MPACPYGERLLVRVFLEYIALPVQPRVSEQSPSLPKQLQPRFRVFAHVVLLIKERSNEFVHVLTIQIAEYNRQRPEISLRAKERKQMRALLILLTLPTSYIMVCITRILVRAVVNQRVKTQLQLDLT